MVTFFKTTSMQPSPILGSASRRQRPWGLQVLSDGSTFRHIHMPEDHDLHRTHERCQLAAETSLSSLLFPGVDVERPLRSISRGSRRTCYFLDL